MPKYKPGDIVLAKSPAGEAIPAVHVKLIKREHVKAKQGNTIVWPEYVIWDAELVKPAETDMLRKKFGIPFSFPKDIATRVFEDNIVKVIKRNRVRKKLK